MKLILKTKDREIPCIDWPTALVGMRTIPDAQGAVRRPAAFGKVAYVQWPWAGYTRDRGLWVFVRVSETQERVFMGDTADGRELLDKLMAGEDV